MSPMAFVILSQAEPTKLSLRGMVTRRAVLRSPFELDVILRMLHYNQKVRIVEEVTCSLAPASASILSAVLLRETRVPTSKDGHSGCP